MTMHRRGSSSVKASPAMPTNQHPQTPDGRYFVVRGRLWRMSNPAIGDERKADLVRQLMAARRALKKVARPEERLAARAQVDAAKRALGERGPVWWDDGAPDYNRQMVVNTPYADWYVMNRPGNPGGPVV